MATPSFDAEPPHRQVVLPELGFTVDEGLEEIVRACWRRGIATVESCIGHRRFGKVGTILFFCDFAHASRWEHLTGLEVEAFHSSENYEDDDEDVEGEWIISAWFPPSDIPTFVDALGTVDEFELKAYRAEIEQYNKEGQEIADLGPFHAAVRRQRLARERQT